MDWTKLFFSADGRIGRQAYWIGWLVLIGVNTLLFWVPFLSLVTIYCWICICSKRFHDMGRSGWLSAIPVSLSIVVPIGAVIAIAGAAIASSLSGATEGTIVAAVLSAVAGSALLLILLERATQTQLDREAQARITAIAETAERTWRRNGIEAAVTILDGELAVPGPLIIHLAARDGSLLLGNLARWPASVCFWPAATVVCM